LKRLQHVRDESGKPLEIVTLPMPRPLYYQGQRLPCSYANFYIANGVVLVPTYDEKSDPAALDTLRRLFPSRTVVGMDATDLVWGLGAFHCVTQQQPLV
jgi:agmatine deiminase